jgi:hypothetical protein
MYKPGGSPLTIENDRQELINILTAEFNNSPNNLNNNAILKLSLEFIELAENQQQQLIN